MNNNNQTEINNLEIPNQGNVNVNEELHYNKSYRFYIPTNHVTQYTNMITVEVLLHSKAILHINEKR